MIAERIEVARAERILVLDAGDGALARQLAGRAPDGLAVGLDESDEMVQQARRLSADIDNLMFVPGSPVEIPWREDFFTLVVSEQAARWPDPERAAREVVRVLSLGGRVILEAPVEWLKLLAAAGFDRVESAAGLVEARKLASGEA